MIHLSCALATSRSTPELAALAERLGYHTVWCYDSPALYGDVWMGLARVAERTTRIRLGPGVLVPGLRHPMVTAAAVATLADLAPGRVTVGLGSGFTGRMALGQRPLPWAQVETYVRVVRTLLAGGEATWEERPVRMLHAGGTVAGRPVDVPVLIGADGPRGVAVAEAVGDGIISARIPVTAGTLAHRALVVFGTVLDPGEDPASERAYAAAGPGVLLAYHAAYALRGRDSVLRLPGGERWLKTLEEVPEERRHLAVHEGHVTAPNAVDRSVRAESAAVLPRSTLTGDPGAVRARVEEYAAAGVTELVFQPAGPDIPRELTAMAEAAAPAVEGADR